MEEFWKKVTILPFQDSYDVSSIGRVRKGEKILSPFKKNKKRYLMVTLNYLGAKRNFYVHRLVAEAFVQKPSNAEGLVVDHVDANIFNNSYENFEWITQEENNRRQVACGRGIFTGKDNFNYKIDIEKAINLRNRGMTFTAIGNIFGCSYVAVRECIKKNGLYTPTIRSPQVIDTDVIAMRISGMIQKDIATHFNCSRTVVKRILRENGMK